jgi:phage baseplate assembly protein gpV
VTNERVAIHWTDNTFNPLGRTIVRTLDELARTSRFTVDGPNFTLHGNLTVHGNLKVSGAITVERSVAAYTHSCNSLTVNGNLFVRGRIHVRGNIEANTLNF